MTTNPKDHLYSTKTGLGLAQIPAALVRLLGTFESLPLQVQQTANGRKENRVSN